jgi:hypothetical protein
MCARPSASVNGSARIATVNVSGVALTSSPLPLSNALLKWYDTLSLAVARRGTPAVAAMVISAKRPGGGAREGTRASLDAGLPRGEGRRRPGTHAVVCVAEARDTTGINRARRM